MDTFVITGMTCANCSARIEKELNGQPVVNATVNLATEKQVSANMKDDH